MNVGYIGLGNMGGALASRLQMTHQLLVHDPNDDAVARLTSLGAEKAENLADVGERCSIIVLCLPTSELVEKVIFGEGGLAATVHKNTLIIDQTSGDPLVTRSLSDRLAEQEVFLIDAPVSGGTRGAQDGTIAIMVGAGHDQYEKALPVLSAISSNVFHAGGVGNGHVIKLVNNLLSGAQRLLTFEGMALAAKNGVEPEVAHAILMASGGRNAYLEKIMGPNVLNGKLAAGFTLGLAHKDVRLACQLGDSSEVPMAFGNLTRELYEGYLRELGADAQVDTALLSVEREAGTQVVPDVQSKV